MRALVALLVLVVGSLTLALVWTNHSQVETIALLRVQNALLQSQVVLDRRLTNRQEALNAVYSRLLGDVITWLGLDVDKALGGP
jgi:Tfp pilus assembly protein PilV